MLHEARSFRDHFMPNTEYGTLSGGQGGRIGIVEHRLDGGGPGPPLQDRVAPETIITTAEAVGLQLLTHDESFRYQYLLVFVENSSKNNSGTER